MKRTIGYLPWGNSPKESVHPFESLFTHKINCEGGFGDIDCLILWGGQDIHPSYYRQGHQKFNSAGAYPSKRDVAEWKAMLYCKANNIPMIGICRGAQFLCAFAGGSLAQHVHSHSHDHMIATSDGRKLWTTSVHHQMMNPHGIAHELLAWSDPGLSQIYLNDKEEHIAEMLAHDEPEVVFFPTIRGLAIQGHPEYGSATKDFQEYCVEMVGKYLFMEQPA